MKTAKNSKQWKMPRNGGKWKSKLVKNHYLRTRISMGNFQFFVCFFPARRSKPSSSSQLVILIQRNHLSFFETFSRWILSLHAWNILCSVVHNIWPIIQSRLASVLSMIVEWMEERKTLIEALSSRGKYEIFIQFIYTERIA